MKEEVKELKKELKEVKEQTKDEKSWAMTVLDDYQKTNKRLFIVLIVVLCMWFSTIAYLVYVLNDIGTYDSIEIEDVETIDNSHIKIGDDVWEKSE